MADILEFPKLSETEREMTKAALVWWKRLRDGDDKIAAGIRSYLDTAPAEYQAPLDDPA